MKLSFKQTQVMRQLFLVLLLLTIPAIYALAGPDDPGGDPGAPIDGGLSLLVAAGIGYGAKKAQAARKKVRNTATDENQVGEK